MDLKIFRSKPEIDLSIVSLTLCSLFFCSSSRADNQPADGPVTKPGEDYAEKIQSLAGQDGPIQFDVIDNMVFHDATRNKDLQVKAKIPQGPGPFPVIIFSHGKGGSKESYRALTRFWATNGYVCFMPTHADSQALRKEEGVEAEDTPIGTDHEGWRNRALDLKLILDSLPEISKRPKFQGKMDLNRIGVGGHSYGAFTAELLSGGKVKIPKEGIVSFADSRVKAFEEMSPSGLADDSHQGMANEHCWDDVHAAVIVFTGTHDQLLPGHGPKWRMEAYKFLPQGDKYLAFVNGATHNSYVTVAKGKNGAVAANQTPLVNYTEICSLAFWDAYLKEDDQAKKYLNSQKLPNFSNGIVKLDHK